MAKPKILILTIPEDHHAYAVAQGLRLKGADPILWFTPDFPTKALETVRFDGDVETIEVHDIDQRLLEMDVASVWNRRIREEIVPASLDPADRGFARAQCSRFRSALISIISENALAKGCMCVNPWEGALRAENKLRQQHVAAQVGLEMPVSLYTNDPTEIRRFMDRHGGKVIYKPFLSGIWDDGVTAWGNFTNAIGPEDLVDDDLLQAVPGIYQEKIPKAFELRVTMMGERAFAARINSQETEHGKLDWRRAYQHLTMEPWSLPDAVRLRCLELMRRLGIVFGCLDFVVTPDGRHVFLEVNQAGQFLFVEQYSGLPLLDAFCELLIQGRCDFEPGDAEIRVADLADASASEMLAERDRHVPCTEIASPETRASQPPEMGQRR